MESERLEARDAADNADRPVAYKFYDLRLDTNKTKHFIHSAAYLTGITVIF